jgi:hypothetical protein
MRIVTVDAALDLIAGATAHALRPQTTFSQEFSHG